MDLVTFLSHLDWKPHLRRIPKRLLMRLLKNPIVVVSAATLGVRIGKDAYQMKTGEIDPKEFRARAGSHLGSVSGGVFGAAAGAAALSVVPGVGTILGAFAGGMVGESIGAKLGRKSAEHAEVYFAKKSTAGAEREPTTKRTM
jgi:phage tail tape-measure protein